MGALDAIAEAGHRPGARHLLLVTILSVLLGSACSNGSDHSLVSIEAKHSIPVTELADWVSYGDAVVVVSITSERDQPMSAEQEKTGEGALDRRVTMEVEDVVWTRPGADRPPEVMEVLATGWLLHDGERKPYTLDNLPRLTVGHEYLMPLADFDEAGWDTMSMHLELDGNKLLTVDGTEARPYQSDLGGLTVRESTERITSTEPDPVATEAAAKGADPVERFAAVQSAKRQVATTRPSP